MEFDTLVGEITERIAIETPGLSEVLTPEVVAAIWNFKAEAGEAYAAVAAETEPARVKEALGRLAAILKKHKTEILRHAPTSHYTLEKILASASEKIIAEAGEGLA